MDFLAHVAGDSARLRRALARLVDHVDTLHKAGGAHGELCAAAVRFSAGDGFEVAGPDDGPAPARYHAPERAGGPPTPAADWYAVGVILFEALTGGAPFDGSTDQQFHAAPSVRGLAPGAPSDLAHLASELLERDPARRPGAKELRARLAGHADAGATQAASGDDLTVAVGAGARAALPEAEALPVVPREAYVVKGELGRGGMGRVMRAHDRRLRRTVALKELLDADRGLGRRFQREALITARLEHPSIVSVHEAGRWPSGEPFYAMKLIAGRSFEQVMAEARTLEQRLALLPELLAVTDALAYAHSHRVIHRDLKPANILCGKFGETVVVDWGLAKDLSAEGGDPDAPSLPGVHTERTMAGAVVGTPAYMAPEQARGEPLDERADVYALGAILHRMLTGAAPQAGTTAEDMLTRVRKHPARPVAEREPGLPPDLASIVDRALAFERDARYPSAGELSDDLRRFLTGQLVASHRYSAGALLRRWARQHRAVLAVAAVALVVLAAGAVISVGRIVRERDRADRERRAADAARVVAERERTVAQRRTDELLVAEAERALDRDPNQALALLAELGPAARVWGAVRVIAADAVARGRSHVLATEKLPLRTVAYAADGRLASLDSGGRVDLWRPGADAPERLQLGGDAHAIAWSSDRLAIAVNAGGIQIWDAAGKQHTLKETQAQVNEMAWSRDGRLLVVSGVFGDVNLWEVDSFRTRRAVRQPRPAGLVQFSPDGSLVASIDAGHGGLYLSPVNPGPSRTLVPSTGDIVTARFTPDGKTLVAGGGAGLTLFSLPDGTASARLPGVHITSLVIAPDGSRIYAADFNGIIHIESLVGVPPILLTGHAGGIRRLEISADGDHLVSAGVDGTVRVWRVNGQVHVLRGHINDVTALALHGDDIATGGDDRTVRRWELPLTRELVGEGEPITQLALGPHGEIAVGGWKGWLRRWAPGQDTPEILSRDGAERDNVTSLFFVGDTLISMSNADGLRAWDAAGAVRKLGGRANHVAPLPDGKTLVIGSANGPSLLDLASGQQRPLGAAAPATEMAVSADAVVGTGFRAPITLWRLDGTQRSIGKIDLAAFLSFLPDGRVASGGMEGRVQLWSPSGGAPQLLGKMEQLVRALAVSPDGRWLVAAGDPELHVFDLRGGAPRRLTGHGNTTTELAFSPAGELASGDLVGELRLWDLESGVSRLVGYHSDQVTGLGFLADALVSCAMDGTVRVWRDDLPRDPAALRAWLKQATRAPSARAAGAPPR